MRQLRTAGDLVAKAVILVMLAIWFLAASAGAYCALVVFWPFLSVVYLLFWPIARYIDHADTSGWGISVKRRSGHLRRIEVGGSDLPLGKRVFVTVNPELSVELAAPRWLQAVYLVLWTPFILPFPLFIATSLLQLAAREEPRVMVESPWLATGAVLLAGLYVGLVACVSWAGHEFIGPRAVGRRLSIPGLGLALCIAHHDVCAVEVGRDTDRDDHVRLIRTAGEPVELRAAARFIGHRQPAADLLPLAELFANAAHVPLVPATRARRN